MKTSLIEFLEEVRVENITFQTLHSCMTGASVKKGGWTEVKFITREITPGDIGSTLSRTAFIVWMDAGRFDTALKKIKGK